MTSTSIDMLEDLLSGSPEAVADPFPTYHALRTTSPIMYSDTMRMWFATRYADVTEGLRDRRMSARRMPTLVGSMDVAPDLQATIIDRATRQMINSDAPDHARRRALVAAAFHPRRIESYRERVRETAHALLDAVIDQGEIDLVADFAFPLPMAVLADIVGIPSPDARLVKAWADDVAGFMSKGHVDASQVASYLSSWSAMSAYFRERLQQPDDVEEHVVNQLAMRIAEGETDEDEALANLVLLAVAGHETTTNTIGLGVLALLRNPDQFDAIRRDETLIPSAVEELLRYEPIAQWDFRLATEDVEIAGMRIAEGQLVNFVLAAANRDPEVFEEPDRLDVRRSPNRHVTFGIGVHHCLGSQLARLELQVALECLIRRIRTFELAGPPLYRPNVRMRGLEHLRLRIVAA